MAAEAAGLVRVSGNATIDGRPCQSVEVWFTGEKLVTGSGSNAVVTAPGTVVSLASNTIVKLGGRSSELIEGLVVVSSEGASITRVDDLTISTPAGARGKFLAKRLDDELQLLALEGRIDLTDGQQTEPVPATTGVKIKLPKRSNEQKISHREAGGTSWLKNDDIGMLMVVAGAVTAGVILGIVNSQNAQPVTPPHQKRKETQQLQSTRQEPHAGVVRFRRATIPPITISAATSLRGGLSTCGIKFRSCKLDLHT